MNEEQLLKRQSDLIRLLVLGAYSLPLAIELETGSIPKCVEDFSHRAEMAVKEAR